MQEETRRIELGRRLYAKDPAQYSDVRRYKTLVAMQKRMATLRTMLIGVPASKRHATNARYRKLCWEQLMLKWKHQLYAKNTLNLPPIIALIRMQLQLSDRHSYYKLSVEENERERREHAAHLIYIVLRLKPIEEIEQRLAVVDEPLPTLK